MSRSIRSVLATAALLAGMATPAAAATATAPAPEVAAAQILAAAGIDPATAVIQQGIRNYAGPDCPGAGWACVESGQPVIQLSGRSGGENQFQCTASDGVDTNSCLVVQVSVSGTNNAKCIMTDGAAIQAQMCSITQSNTNGNNHAQVHLRIEQDHDGAEQTADQQADVSQTNDRGKNDAHVFERVDQDLSSEDTSGDITQSQDSSQSASVDQESVSGNNSSFIHQGLAQDAEAEGDAAITQEQNADDNGPDLDADVEQDSDTGKNASQLRQDIDQHADAESEPGPLMQTQGSFSGGSDGQVNQSSQGVSTSTNDQDEQQTLEAETTGLLSQTQVGPQRCCSSQFDNPNNKFEIDQTSVQTAAPDANQFNQVQGDCNTSGNCMVDQQVTQNGETTTNSCSSQSCDIFIFCAEGECTPGSGGID